MCEKRDTLRIKTVKNTWNYPTEFTYIKININGKSFVNYLENFESQYDSSENKRA